MRGNLRNTGMSVRQAAARDDLRVRRFPTGNAVFSTPVIGSDETVYVGSADTQFYALDPVSGTVRWSKRLGEVIDSAACIGDDGTVYVPCGDATLYAFRRDGEEAWRLNLLAHPDGFSPSTIYWLEANVAMGANGWLYFGCDNFRFYAVEPGKGVRWSHLTGMHIWSCPAFPDADTVVVPSFDMHVYAFDAATGAVRWKSDVGNFVASSPAVGEDGTLYLGSFDKRVYALHGATGKLLWSVETGGVVYASPALAPDGLLYVGAHDGCIYAIDTRTARIVWKTHTMAPIHSSIAIGQDPQQRCPYLLYVGGGDGCVYALEPDGTHRWVYDTVQHGRAGAHAVNASVALGNHGLATATASGEVVYIPYRAYLQQQLDPGFRPKMASRQNGATPLLFDASGRVRMLAPGMRVRQQPGAPCSLGIATRQGPATLQYDGCRIRILGRKQLQLKTALSPDGTQLHLLPDPHAAPGIYRLQATLKHQTPAKRGVVQRSFTLAVPERAEASTQIPDAFRIRRMLVSSPPVVASFDQIGIASLSIAVRILRWNPVTGSVCAWGVQKFGIADDGSAVGVPCPRYGTYAFGGTLRDGVLHLRARDCQFEITAFQVPLDTLEFTLAAHGGRVRGGTLFGEVQLRDLSAHLPPRLLAGAGAAKRLFPQVMPAIRHSLDSAAMLAKGSAARLGGALVGMGQVGTLGLRILAEESWRPWGLFDKHGCCRTIGTCETEPLPATAAALALRDMHVDMATRRIHARFSAHGPAAASTIPGIVLLDHATGEPVPLNYCLYTKVQRDASGIPTTCELRIPRWVRLGAQVTAIAMADTHMCGSVELHGIRQRLAWLRHWLLGRRPLA